MESFKFGLFPTEVKENIRHCIALHYILLSHTLICVSSHINLLLNIQTRNYTKHVMRVTLLSLMSHASLAFSLGH